MALAIRLVSYPRRRRCAPAEARVFPWPRPAPVPASRPARKRFQVRWWPTACATWPTAAGAERRGLHSEGLHRPRDARAIWQGPLRDGRRASVPASCGKVLAAERHSGQPARHTSELAPTRPSVIQARMISPDAGPNCPPVAGRTYQTALGASSIGSRVARDECRRHVAAAAVAGGRSPQRLRRRVVARARQLKRLVESFRCRRLNESRFCWIGADGRLAGNDDAGPALGADGLLAAAESDLTCSLCPLGHKNLMPIFVPIGDSRDATPDCAAGRARAWQIRIIGRQ